MRIEGQHVIAASPEIVWSLLQDPLTLKNVLSGCESLEPIATDGYRVTMNIRVGPKLERLTGSLRFLSIDPLRGFTYAVDLGDAEGSLAARGHTALEPHEGGATLLSYEAEITAGGRLAQVSPRMLQTSARALSRRSLEALDKQVAVRTRIYTTSTTPVADGAAPSMDTAEHNTRFQSLLIFVSILLAILLFRRNRERRQMRLITPQVDETFAQSLVQSASAAIISNDIAQSRS